MSALKSLYTTQTRIGVTVCLCMCFTKLLWRQKTLLISWYYYVNKIYVAFFSVVLLFFIIIIVIFACDCRFFDRSSLTINLRWHLLSHWLTLRVFLSHYTIIFFYYFLLLLSIRYDGWNSISTKSIFMRFSCVMFDKNLSFVWWLRRFCIVRSMLFEIEICRKLCSTPNFILKMCIRFTIIRFSLEQF